MDKAFIEQKHNTRPNCKAKWSLRSNNILIAKSTQYVL